MNMPGFTAESSLYITGLHCLGVVVVSNPANEQSITPAFPWLRCLNGCLECLGGGDCVFCRNCGVCLFDLKPCPPIWRL